MKQNIWYLSFLFLGVIFSSNLYAQGYKITFKIKGAENKKADFAYYLGDKQYIKQKAIFDNNGKLIIKGNKKLPHGIYLLNIDRKAYFDLLIRNEQNIVLHSDTTNLIGHMQVKGSEENQLFFNYQQQLLKIQKEISEIKGIIKKEIAKDSLEYYKNRIEVLNNKAQNLAQSIISEHPDSYLAKILKSYLLKDINQFDFADSDLLRSSIYNRMLRLYIKQNINKKIAYIKVATAGLLDSIKKTPANFEYVANYLLNFYNTFYKIGMNEVFVFIVDEYFLPDKAKWFGKKQLEQIKERRDLLSQSFTGNLAPELKMENINNEFISLHQIKSSTTLLYFWSSGCGHCTKATKILKKNYPELTKKNIEIYAVNVDQDSTEWKKKVENMDLQWINVQDPMEISGYREKYYVYGTPLLYVLDKKKKIIAKENGENEIKNLIDSLLK